MHNNNFMSLVDTKKTTSSTSGIKKTIDEQSMEIALEVLQSSMYQYPIKSTVREVTSNALDAVKERMLAVDIIKGRKKVEDHFIDRKEGIYHSSAFDKDYYDIKALSDSDVVTLTYTEGTGSVRDTFSVKDCGVGLGGGRLENYFTLNYSSKRNSKDYLGSFGLGSKSPLSTGCESFRMISVYNGLKYRFDIYIDKIESVVPKFDDEGLNEVVEFSNGYQFYAEKTDDLNGVEIIIETKKHHRREYIQAVKSQLLYFKNLSFDYHYEGYSYPTNQEIKAEVIYEDDNIVISNNSQYSAPHIILGTSDTKVAYGTVDFDELELEHRSGAVGLKMDVSELTVTPSRENVVWNTKTRKAVIEKFEKVQSTAAKYIQDSLKGESDFLKWIRKVNAIFSTSSSQYSYKHGMQVIDPTSSTIGILSEIVDKDSIEIVFSGDKTIKFIRDINKFFKNDAAVIRVVTKDYWSKKIKREAATSWSDFDIPIYEYSGKADNLKDTYLTNLHTKFLLVKRNEDSENKSGVKGLELILKSYDVKQYDEVEVPDDIEAVEPEKSTITAAERRKANNQIVFFRLEANEKNTILKKMEFKVKEVEEFDCTIVYGNKVDMDDLQAVAMSYFGSNKSNSKTTTTKGIMAVQVSKVNTKKFKDIDNAIHVKDYLYNTVKNGIFVIPELMSNYLYAKYIDKHLNTDFCFMEGFSPIDNKMYKMYKDVSKYNTTNHKTRIPFSFISKYYSIFKKVMNIQLEGEKDDDYDYSAAIKKVIPEFKKDITGVHVLELNSTFDKVETLKTYTKPIKSLLNSVTCITNGYGINKALSENIKTYIKILQDDQ